MVRVEVAVEKLVGVESTVEEVLPGVQKEADTSTRCQSRALFAGHPLLTLQRRTGWLGRPTST